MDYVLGIDIGGTKSAAGIVSSSGELLASGSIPTSRDGAESILDATAGFVSSLLAEAGVRISGIGIGAAGVIDADRGVVVSATDSIPGWAGTALTAGVTARTGQPAWAVNDVHAHALGESWIGAAAVTSSALLVALGTGIGGSFVLEGRPELGARFAAGHVGHFASPYAVDDAGTPLPCSCGRAGHVEAIASGPGIFAHYRRLLAGAPAGAEDTRGVYTLARAGDPAALQAITTGAAAAGQALGGLANILDPEIIVAGGGMAEAGELWWDAMTAAFEAELIDALAGLAVVPASLGNSAAIAGAARLAFDRLGLPGLTN